ncbi:MAG: cytochrome O ubiquinol oxidase [Bacteroidetes bacterium]|nr:MAG: cytochrome O ubiquinol oxidase [Bacteroidota bacterium]
MKEFFKKYKKPILITSTIIILNVVYGFDARFTVINIVWLFV